MTATHHTHVRLGPMDAAETIISRHVATAKRIAELLQQATDDGTLDELAAFVSPDIINEFCDAISDMTGEST